MGSVNITTNGESTFCLSLGKPSYVNKTSFGFIVSIGGVADVHSDYFSVGKASKIRALEYLIDVKVDSNRYTFTWQEYPVKDLEVGDKIGTQIIGGLENFEDYRGNKKVRITYDQSQGPDIVAEYDLNAFMPAVTKANPSIVLEKGNYYTFIQSDSSNANHPMVFKSGSSIYETDVLNNFDDKAPGTAGSFTRIKVTKDTPDNLKYACQTHGDSYGNTLSIEDGDVAILALFDTVGEKQINIRGGMGEGNFVAERILMLSAEYDRSFCDTPENIKSIAFDNYKAFAWHGYGEFAGMKNLTELTLPRVDAKTIMIHSLNPESKIQHVDSGGEMHFVRTFAETGFVADPGVAAAFASLLKAEHNLTKLVGTFEGSQWSGRFYWDTSKVTDWTNCFKNSAYTGGGLDLSSAQIIDGLFSGQNSKWTFGMNGFKFPNCTSAKRVFQDNENTQESAINGWSMPNVTSMKGFFQGSSRTTSFYLTAPSCEDFSYFLSDTTQFNGRFSLTSDAQNISFEGFLRGAKAFRIHSNWIWGVNAVQKAVNFKDFFKGTAFAGNISNWFAPGHQATNISGMLSDMTEDYIVAAGKWDFSPFEDVSYLFANSKAVMSYNSQAFTNVLTCEGFYQNNSSFSTSGMRTWRFPKCKNFSHFFENSQVKVAVIDWLSKGNHVAEDVSYMFANAKLNAANNLDLGSIKKARYMFMNHVLNSDVMGYSTFGELEDAEGMFQRASYPGRMRNWRFPKLKSAVNMFKGATLSTRKAYTRIGAWFSKTDSANLNQTSVLEDISGMFDGTKNFDGDIRGWNWIQPVVKKANRTFAQTENISCSNLIPRFTYFKNLTEFNEIFEGAAWLTDECDLTGMTQPSAVINNQINMVKNTEYTGRWRDEEPKVSEDQWVPFIIVPAPKTVQKTHPCSENFEKDFDAIEIEDEEPGFVGKKNTIFMRIPTF